MPFKPLVRFSILVRHLAREVRLNQFNNRRKQLLLNKEKFVAALIAASLVASSAVANDHPPTPQEIAISEIEHTFKAEPNDPALNSRYVQAVVQQHFADAPVMVHIARCESEFRQYHPDGRLNVNSAPNSSASGVFQILYKMHYDSWASNLDQTDITTLEGNIAFARLMYESQGTAPWNQSKECWNPRLASN